jgi:RHS repeat-associated protein
VLRSDGLDRLVEVKERNGAETYVTRYAWNVRGELTSIVDAQGNTKRFRFDSMSRLVEVDDPDRGLLRTTFDDAGNATERLDARGRKVAMTYDEADRPLEKIHRGAGAGGADIVETRWHYDEPAGVLDFGDGSSGVARNTRARLAWAEDRTGETHYSYDERGNVEWVLKRVRDEATGLLVPFRTQRRHDLLDREVEIVFPDNDLLRFDHGQGSFVTSIRGDGAGAGTILAEAEYSGSGRPFRLLWGNGVESLFEYDENDRLEAERLLAGDGTALRHERLEYDAVSNIVAVDDLRPTAAVPADSPRRTTARFDYDELHRLGRASYGAGGSLGIVNYAYDALGNLLEQTTPPVGQPGHIGDPRVRLGAVSYAGGRTGRSGRRPGDPPGPHALTGSAGGLALSYDADGNVVRHGEAELTWDHEDRIEAFDGPDSSATYAYDHSGRRAVRRVRRGSAVEEIWHVDPACEVRGAGTVVKYAFLDGRRVARIEGRLGPGRDAVQVVRLASGWNLVSAAVETAASLRDAFGADAAVWGASGASYAPVSLATAVAPGRALWVHVPTARVASLRGAPRSSAGGVVSPGQLHAWPSLDAFRPARDLEGAPPLVVFDAGARRWLRRDPALPAFLSEAPPELGSAQAFWSGGEVRFRSATSRPASIVFYHADAVDSVAAMTDEGGALVEERARYPFGAIRNIHRPGGPLAGSDHDFTGHERDSESGLVHMGARSYLDLAGVFLSPDPLYVAAAALGGDDGGKLAEFLANPQMGNLYAHALRQPLKYVDPDGLEVVFSKSVSSDPNFKYAWKAFAATQRGQRVLKSLEHAKGRVYITDGKVRGPKVTGKGIGVMMAKVFGPTSKLDMNVEDRMAVVTIDLAEHAKRSGLFGPSGTMDNIARDIHRELRKVQVNIGVSEMFKSGVEAMNAAGKATDPAKQMQHLENAGGWFEWGAEKLGYITDPSSDPANKEFDQQLHEDQRPR